MSVYDRHMQDYMYGKYVEARQAGNGRLFALTVRGYADMERRVAGLSDIEKSKAIRAGLRNGSNLLKRRGRSRLKQRNYNTKSGGLTSKGKEALAAHNLYNSFQTRIKRRSLGALVGFSGKGHHSHLVDLGTRKRPHPISGTSGIMPASRFWTDTAELDWSHAMEKVMEGIERAMDRIILRRE